MFFATKGLCHADVLMKCRRTPFVTPFTFKQGDEKCLRIFFKETREEFYVASKSNYKEVRKGEAACS